jgi:hypothetical protein
MDLKGNHDTKYKETPLDPLSKDAEQALEAGEVELEGAASQRTTFKPGFPRWVECLMTSSPDFANRIRGLMRVKRYGRGVPDG